MGGNEGNEGQSGKGFSGLSSMVSDVGTSVASAERDSGGADDSPGKDTAAGTQPHRQVADRQQSHSEGYQEHLAQPTSAGGSSAGKWLLGIGAIIGFVWLLSESGNKSSAPSPTYTSPPQSPSTAPPAPSWQPPAAAPRPQVSGSPSEEKPPVGTDLVLSVPQIRYCVAEDIRLDAAKGVINNFIESDVDRFNSMVSDYNSRCGQFRYRRGALESARSDIEAVRSVLQAEGRNRFQRTPGLSLDSPPQGGTRPAFDGVVFAVQRRLNELGYDVGTPDGLAGAKTRSAISAFQRVHGLPVDGMPSTSLVSRLEAVKSTRPNVVPSERSSTRATSETNPTSVSSAAPTQRAPDLETRTPQARTPGTRDESEPSKPRIPRNATLDVYGTGWVCVRGYRRVGDECQAVVLPSNATLDVYGSGWVCQRGYRKVGSECQPVQIPLNATLDVYGSGWVCQRGYRQVGNECQPVQIPLNATLDVYGSGWVCQRGYRQVGNQCQPL